MYKNILALSKISTFSGEATIWSVSSGGILRVIQFWCLNQIIIWLNSLIVPQAPPHPPRPCFHHSKLFLLPHQVCLCARLCKFSLQPSDSPSGGGGHSDSIFTNVILGSQMCFWICVPFVCNLMEFRLKRESQHFLESNWSLMIFWTW